LRNSEELIINVLREAGEDGITQVELTRITGLSRSRISEILSKLEREGKIIRIRLPGRTYLVKLAHYRVKEKAKILNIGILRALEYPFIIPFIKRLRSKGFRVHLWVYDNAIPATYELVRGILDLALTPIITQFYFYELTKALRIIGGGAVGGAFIVLSPRRGDLSLSDLDTLRAASTKFSTMEICGLALTKGKMSRIYVHKAEDFIKYLLKGVADYAVTWQPYVKILEERGCNVFAKCEDIIGPYHCCTLAVSMGIDDNTISLLTKLYEESFKDIKSNVNEFMKVLSRIIGINEDYAKYSLNAYSFLEYIDLKIAINPLRRAYVNLPDPLRLNEALWRL